MSTRNKPAVIVKDLAELTTLHQESQQQKAQEESAQLTAHIGRFKTFHGIVCRSALEMKLAKYFAGLEVNALVDLHREMHGETRGQFAEESKTERPSVLLEPFLEQHLGVTARTARKYRGFFQSIGSESPEIADKLNDFWVRMTLPAASGEASGETQLAVSGVMSKLPAETLHAICTHADEWGLHELFGVPERDVTPPDPDEHDDSERKKAEKAALMKFWTESIIRRLDNEELHRLPPASLEAVITKMETAMTKAREVLAAKTAKKKGGRK